MADLTPREELIEEIAVAGGSERAFDPLVDAVEAAARAEHVEVIVRWLLKQAAQYRLLRSCQSGMRAETIEHLADKIRRGAARPNNLLMPTALAAAGQTPAPQLHPLDDMTPQECPAGVHPDWAADTDRSHACPWCRIAELEAAGPVPQMLEPERCENCGHAAHGHAEHLTDPAALRDCPDCPCAAELREMDGEEVPAPELETNGCPFCATSTNPDLMDHVMNVHPDEFCAWAHGPGCSRAPRPEGNCAVCGEPSAPLEYCTEHAEPGPPEPQSCRSPEGIPHTEHCPTPETHNWGCGCPSGGPAQDGGRP